MIDKASTRLIKYADFLDPLMQNKTTQILKLKDGTAFSSHWQLHSNKLVWLLLSVNFAKLFDLTRAKQSRFNWYRSSTEMQAWHAVFKMFSLVNELGLLVLVCKFINCSVELCIGGKFYRVVAKLFNAEVGKWLHLL